jgi:hypothetical protein
MQEAHSVTSQKTAFFKLTQSYVSVLIERILTNLIIFQELKRLLNDKLKLGSNKVKPPAKGSYWVYVCFRSEEDRQNALLTLDGYTWKNKILTAAVKYYFIMIPYFNHYMSLRVIEYFYMVICFLSIGC